MDPLDAFVFISMTLIPLYLACREVKSVALRHDIRGWWPTVVAMFIVTIISPMGGIPVTACWILWIMYGRRLDDREQQRQAELVIREISEAIEAQRSRANAA